MANIAAADDGISQIEMSIDPTHGADSNAKRSTRRIAHGHLTNDAASRIAPQTSSKRDTLWQ